MGSTAWSCYIQNDVIMRCVINRLHCTNHVVWAQSIYEPLHLISNNVTFSYRYKSWKSCQLQIAGGTLRVKEHSVLDYIFYRSIKTAMNIRFYCIHKSIPFWIFVINPVSAIHNGCFLLYHIFWGFRVNSNYCYTGLGKSCSSLEFLSLQITVKPV